MYNSAVLSFVQGWDFGSQDNNINMARKGVVLRGYALNIKKGAVLGKVNINNVFMKKCEGH